MFLLVILIGLGLVCFTKLDSEGYERVGFMLTYLMFALVILEKFC